MTDKSQRIEVPASKDLKGRLENYSDDNEISMSGAVRMILNQNLPEVKE